ncbi:MAG: acyl-CoA dehydrogenase family protein [Baekduia sp.]
MMTRPAAEPDTPSAFAATSESLLEACRVLVAEQVEGQVEAWDRDDVLPEVLLSRLSEIGLPGALVPPEYGGRGVSVSDLVDVWRTLARGWISLTGAVNTTHMAAALLLRHGTEPQRRRWLPSIAAGETWASFSITEPGAGSDLSRLEAWVEPSDGGLVITGQKRWIAGGLSFPLAFMLARVKGETRPSCIVLPAEGRGTETWSVESLDKLGYRGVESAAWRFNRHFVPGAEILGGEEGHGRGAHQMIDVLSIGRVNVACRALGIVDRTIGCALAESTGRGIGRGVLGDHSHTQLRVGELRCRQLVIEAMIRRAAAAVDADDPLAPELAVAAKVIASEDAVRAVESASRLAASRSYIGTSELARLRRDAPQTQIGEGANDALLIASGKSMIKQHVRATTSLVPSPLTA